MAKTKRQLRTYWRCIKCARTMIKGDVARFRCMCGRWCIDITKITTKMKEKGDLTADQVNHYQEILQARCL